MSKNTEKKAVSKAFEIEGEFKNAGGVPFHNFEKDGQLRGVYLGPGKKMSTEKSEGEFSTLAFLNESGEVVFIPEYKVLENVKNEAAHGEYFYIISSEGQKTGEKRTYNTFTVKRAKLKTPLNPGVDYNPQDWM